MPGPRCCQVHASAWRKTASEGRRFHRSEFRTEAALEGERIAEQVLPASGASRFLDAEYPLPARLTEGRRKVTVRFEATQGRDIAPVSGVRIGRADESR